jgi:hypothetical protein
MLTAALGALVARPSPPDLDPMDQPQRLELVERPVDAGPGDRDLAVAQVFLELQRRDGAVMARERLDHRKPGTSLLIPGVLKRGERVLDPLPVDATRDGADRRSAIGGPRLAHARTAAATAASRYSATSDRATEAPAAVPR